MYYTRSGDAYGRQNMRDVFTREEIRAWKPKKIKSNSTWKYFPPGYRYVIKYHYTDIIKVTCDNTMILDNGGWFTRSTNDRFGEFCPMGSISGIKNPVFHACGITIPFENGMEIPLEPLDFIRQYYTPPYGDIVAATNSKFKLQVNKDLAIWCYNPDIFPKNPAA